MRSIISRRITAIIGASLLGVGVLGGAAMAAVPATSAQVQFEERDSGRHAELMTRVLTGLVDKGVITQEQAQQILRAFAEAAKDGAGDHKRFKLAWNAMRAAIDYIGLPAEAVRAQLSAGKTLGEIADTQPGKSREGLIRSLHEKAQEAVTTAVGEGKLTAEEGRELMERLDAGILTLVDKKWDDRGPRPATRSN